jgi:hypothetical protein
LAGFTWDEGVAAATTSVSHNIPLGSVANVVISQTNTGFDGVFRALSVSPLVLTYDLSTNPQAAGQINGAVNFNLNLVASVIPGGYLLYRYDTQQIEYG